MIQPNRTNKEYAAILLNRKLENDNNYFNQLVEKYSEAIILDQFASQKKELIKICNPQSRFSSEEIDAIYAKFIFDKNEDYEGTWIYYPWLNKLIHTLSKEEFIQLRTSRNQHRITSNEQQLLGTKTIGIIGLSIGHSVALTIASERICGKLKLADFDTLELSNLNRIRTGIQNIGLNKCIITARQIAEIDPYLEVECFTDGITDDNLDAFLTQGRNLDLLIDECDGLEIKIACRQKAKLYRIPVIMETSDRGMLDVERFDLETDRPIFHGLLEGIPEEKLKNIAPQDRIPFVMRIVDAQNGSKRGQLSMLEIGQSITTWPQLASAATLGGAVVTDTTRRLLLKQFQSSGRYYVDLEQIIPVDVSKNTLEIQNPFEPFQFSNAASIVKAYPKANPNFVVEESKIRYLIEMASKAPSIRNSQPWKWLYDQNRIFLFHDRNRSFAFDNFDNTSAYISFGTAIENLTLAAAKVGLKVKSDLIAESSTPGLVGIFELETLEDSEKAKFVFAPELVDQINTRYTDRKMSINTSIPIEHLNTLKAYVESVNENRIHYTTDGDKITKLAEIVSKCDLVTLLNHKGHHDFFTNTINWNIESSKYDGITLKDMAYNQVQLAAISLLKDSKIANTLKEIDGGAGIIKASTMNTLSAGAIGIISVPQRSEKAYFNAGISIQRLWLQANYMGYGIQPLYSPINLFSRITTGDSLTLTEINKILDIKAEFDQIFPQFILEHPVFIFKIFHKEFDQKQVRKRLPLDNISMILNDINE